MGTRVKTVSKTFENRILHISVSTLSSPTVEG